jgi:predicted helicase
VTATLPEILTTYREEATNERHKGFRFEQLMAKFFRLDGYYAREFTDVWLWSDWPGRGNRKDSGIDLVAQRAEDGSLVAIQCKFYDSTRRVSKGDIDSFLAAAASSEFDSAMIVSTGAAYGPQAEESLRHFGKPITRIGTTELSNSNVDWDLAYPDGEVSIDLELGAKFAPRPHQRKAIDDVKRGFQSHDRGKLIMACGTGKTFTSLRLMEELAEEHLAVHNSPFRVLFMVPSIALLSQSLREWTAQGMKVMDAFAVCSDYTASRIGDTAEDISSMDLLRPATTDPALLVKQMEGSASANAEVTVVFSTYQSLPVITRAQQQGLEEFNLIICDEAHRTTGTTLQGEEESNFVRVHYEEHVAAAKRLYMTATPRIFSDKAKKKADENSVIVADMSNEDLYGPEFHRLGFGQAVDQQLLTDYKVMILHVDEERLALPALEVGEEGIKLDDAAKIIGCWNGLAKRTAEASFPEGAPPMHRAVAFARDIKSSKALERTFAQIVERIEGAAGTNHLTCQVRHVDGTMDAMARNSELDWLKSPVAENECRILTNARCLSEGVDVPSLDAVLFLAPRGSVVDVIQSVGRVMRRNDDPTTGASLKDFGYVILPVAIPPGTTPDEAMKTNAFKVVWEVLNALRSHDERMDAIVESLRSGKDSSGKIIIDTGNPVDDEEERANKPKLDAEQLALFNLQYRDSILAKIVENVGNREYWEDWAKNIADIAQTQRFRLRRMIDAADQSTRQEWDTFVQALRHNLNDSIGDDDAISMLSQHLLTAPVFNALFKDYEFAEHNPVAQAMNTVLTTLDSRGLKAEMGDLDGFYHSVRLRASEVEKPEEKQKVIQDLYERFFKLAFARQAESLGIVYTPTEVVDFILRAADDVLKQEFGRGLTDQDVHVLDPFTGTGTFIVRLLESGIITPHDLARKYAHELHANEIMLLAYYIAAVNIEATYHGIVGGDYAPFEGIVLTDTFQMTEHGDTLDTKIFTGNNDRAVAQLDAPITVVVGNPPYSVGQTSANDNNANIKYSALDAAIERTYVARSTATNKNSLYDSYIRAIRWATDRIGDSGVLAYVSNGGWIDGNTADGLRLTLTEEFSTLYVFNLRGNARTSGEQRRKEKDNVFGQGGRTTIAILIAVKNPDHTGPCRIHYRDIGDYRTRQQKLEIVDQATLHNLEWQAIEPNEAGDWTHQRNDGFMAYPAIGDKKDKTNSTTVFHTYSAGLKTGRDAWCYNHSRTAVEANLHRMIENYNHQVDLVAAGTIAPGQADNDPAHINWSASLIAGLSRGRKDTFDSRHLQIGTYRPFEKRWVYFDRAFNERTYQLHSAFPTPGHQNERLYLNGIHASSQFTCLMLDSMPCLDLYGKAGQFFPRWTYEKVQTPSEGQFDLSSEAASDIDQSGYRRIDNITDEILAEHRAKHGDEVSKDDIFYYVYGLLHSPNYRTDFAADLTKMLPRIPLAESAKDYRALVAAGQDLADLHLHYEELEPYPLGEEIVAVAPSDPYELYRVTKMKWKDRQSKTSLVYNSWLMLTGFPKETHQYMLGSRSGVEWLIDRYQVKTDKQSGITNDPNDWALEHHDPTYIRDLVGRIVTLSVETMAIVKSLPALTF